MLNLFFFFKGGIGEVVSGARWCTCCPKCAHLEAEGLAPPKPVYFSVLEAARALLDVAQGLYFLHFHQVLHRDLVSSWLGVVFVCRDVSCLPEVGQHFCEAGSGRRDGAAADWGL